MAISIITAVHLGDNPTLPGVKPAAGHPLASFPACRASNILHQERVRIAAIRQVDGDFSSTRSRDSRA